MQANSFNKIDELFFWYQALIRLQLGLYPYVKIEVNYDLYVHINNCATLDYTRVEDLLQNDISL